MLEFYCKVNESPIPKLLSTGVELITKERERQMLEEGWSAEHDDKHPRGHLALAGACYALNFALYEKIAKELWPWDWEWWKPAKTATLTDGIRELTKAGALIAAEIDKLQRTQSNQEAVK